MTSESFIREPGQELNYLNFFEGVFGSIDIDGPKDWEVTYLSSETSDSKTFLLRVNNRLVASVIHSRTAFNFIEIVNIDFTK